MPTSDANSIFLERHITVCYFLYLSSTNVDTIENQVHPLYIIVDRNQESFFFFFDNISYSQTKD